jgi:hypothetical protein
MLNEENQIRNFILCVSENFCDTILLRFRFRFQTAKSYGSYGSDSITLLVVPVFLTTKVTVPRKNLDLSQHLRNTTMTA